MAESLAGRWGNGLVDWKDDLQVARSVGWMVASGVERSAALSAVLKGKLLAFLKADNWAFSRAEL